MIPQSNSVHRCARLEISLKPGLFDAEGESVKRKARDYLDLSIDSVRTANVLTIDAALEQEQLESARLEIFTNPVTHVSSFSPLDIDFDWLIWVGYLPGVRDAAGSTAVEAMEDLLDMRFGEEDAIYTSKIYYVKGKLTREEASHMVSELLANDLIQQWKVLSRDEWDPDEGIGFNIPRVHLEHEPTVSAISIKSDDELLMVSKERNLALNPADIPTIRNYFLRDDVRAERRKYGLDMPTDVEIEYIAQARSDHCNHNTFRGLFRYRDAATGEEKTVDDLFKTCIEEPTLEIKEKKSWVVSVLWDNAGVGQFGDNYCYTITGETHNSPSNMEPYGGSLTGIVGVYRDPLGTGLGSRLILGMYGYCVGPRDYSGDLRPPLHPRRLLDGVIEGVRDGGNKSGIPTVFGNLFFHRNYIGKCLVFVTTMGIMPATLHGKPAHEKTTSPGDLLIMCGGRVGKDGIHGVTAASEGYGEHTPAGHVQIGDPYTQKKMHDFLLEVRDEGLIEFITDNGGGGLSSSVGESARFSNGCEVQLDRVPLKYSGLDPWEIWVSESQERMTVAIKPVNRDRFFELSRKHDVESTIIGRYTDSGMLHIEYGGRTCAHISIDLLKAGFPQWEFEAEWLPPGMRGLKEPFFDEPDDLGAALKEMLARPNICSREWIARQYDHEVQGGSVIKHMVGKDCDVPGDASVQRPILESVRGIAIAQALNPTYSLIDTYHMTACTIDEAVRRVVAVGGDPEHIGGIDNFCWPSILPGERNPDARFKAAQLVRSNLALRECCLRLGIPLLSGKDSMYIDGDIPDTGGNVHRISGLPTLQFTTVSMVEDSRRCVTMDAKVEGDLVYVLGTTRDELGGSEYYEMLGHVGLNVPELRVGDAVKTYRALHRAIREELVASAHGVYRGGLGIHLVLCAIGGGTGLGMTIDLAAVPWDARNTGSGASGEKKDSEAMKRQGGSLKNDRGDDRRDGGNENRGDDSRDNRRDDRILFSESPGRFIVTIAPGNAEKFEAIMEGCSFARVGKVTGDGRLRIRGAGGPVRMDIRIKELKDAWKSRFGGLI